MSPTFYRRFPLWARVLVGLVCVLGAGAFTAWVVALLAGPAMFHEHMLMVEGADPDPEVVLHAEKAFDAAWTLSLSLALAASLFASVLVSFVFVRRIVRSLNTMRSTALKVADGDYTARVPEVHMEAEFAEPTSGFNRMATELHETENTRRRLLSDLSHEMRTPVATLDGYLEAMQDGVAHPDDETLSMLMEQTERLSRLAADISLVSSAEEHRLTMLHTSLRVGELLTAVHSQARRTYLAKEVRLRLESDDDAESAWIIGDRDRLAQVLTNLLDNALRHTGPGDEVLLKASGGVSEIRLEVKDTGEGIAEEHLPHLFERFYRADTARDRAHGGSGIGLTVVRSIVEAHGGTVRAVSDGEGCGATFAVELPRRAAHQ